MKNPKSLTALAIATAVLLWASSFAVIRSAVAAYPPGAMALLRFSVASLALALYALATGRLKLPPIKLLPPIFACGFLGIALYHTLLNYGEQVISAGAASLLINSAPLWTTLLAVPLLRERFTPRKTSGAITGFLGVLLITLGKPTPTGHYFQFHPAALAILGSAICTSLYVIFQKKFLPRQSALEFTSWTLWAGTLLLAPVFSWQLAATLPAAPFAHTLEIIYLGIFPAAIAYFTFSYATARLPAARVMSFLYLVPPLAMLIAWLYPKIHEIPSLLSLLGGALAITGVALVNSAPKKSLESLIAIEEA